MAQVLKVALKLGHLVFGPENVIQPWKRLVIKGGDHQRGGGGDGEEESDASLYNPLMVAGAVRWRLLSPLTDGRRPAG